MHKAIFLDRDGVVTPENGRPVRAHELEILPNSIEALKIIPQDFKKIIVTNQSWVSRGLLKLEELHEAHKRLQDELQNHKIKLDDIFYCPHAPDDNCKCRKPKPGMILQAGKKHNINLRESYLIGDMPRDIKAGRDAGCKTILVKTGYSGKDKFNNPEIQPDYEAEDLLDAIKLVIKELKR